MPGAANCSSTLDCRLSTNTMPRGRPKNTRTMSRLGARRSAVKPRAGRLAGATGPTDALRFGTEESATRIETVSITRSTFVGAPSRRRALPDTSSRGCSRRAVLTLLVTAHWSRQPQILAQGAPLIFRTEQTSPDQFGDHGVREFVEPSGQVGRLHEEAVDGARRKPFLHLVGNAFWRSFQGALAASPGIGEISLTQRLVLAFRPFEDTPSRASGDLPALEDVEGERFVHSVRRQTYAIEFGRQQQAADVGMDERL